MRKIIQQFIAVCFALISMDVSAQNDTTTDQKNAEAIEGMAEMMAHSLRTPIMRTPDQYGMEYEDIFFPSTDGVTIEGWFIPAKNSKKLIICNHPMPANRYGFPGHLEPWKMFGGFEVNFLPEYKILHDAGYNIIAYDFRNHGRSGAGNGGIVAHGIVEYRDVIDSLNYAKSRPDTKNMQVALYSRCVGANSTFVAMNKHPEEFKNIVAMIALQPSPPRTFVKTAMDNAKIPNGYEKVDAAFKKKTGYVLDDFRLIEKSQADYIPTLVAQVKADFSMPFHYVEEIYNNISAKDKKLFWIEGTDQRFQGYNYFGQNPKVMLDWFDKHFK
ncbi:alpha/beta hydrolase [Pedobacter aquatilis]|uniref:alpha/beta hydrolase family protein n=1 Tax=Pedobacter aquatilis TaxID=351343 RepID=UPI0025B478AF|nr:prolyl oligopeptidase family serine peptidase [Pedobacter aquatilis]MDN3585042.1 alpha/beta hydrolase [Pedobacter aquatilis]